MLCQTEAVSGIRRAPRRFRVLHAVAKQAGRKLLYPPNRGGHEDRLLANRIWSGNLNHFVRRVVPAATETQTALRHIVALHDFVARRVAHKGRESHFCSYMRPAILMAAR